MDAQKDALKTGRLDGAYRRSLAILKRPKWTPAKLPCGDAIANPVYRLPTLCATALMEGMQLLGCAILILIEMATTERLRRGQSVGFWGSKHIAGQITGSPGVVLNPEFIEGGCTWVTISVLSNSTRLRR
jgi:hypothetical protein